MSLSGTRCLGDETRCLRADTVVTETKPVAVNQSETSTRTETIDMCISGDEAVADQ